MMERIYPVNDDCKELYTLEEAKEIIHAEEEKKKRHEELVNQYFTEKYNRERGEYEKRKQKRNKELLIAGLRQRGIGLALSICGVLLTAYTKELGCMVMSVVGIPLIFTNKRIFEID